MYHYIQEAGVQLKELNNKGFPKGFFVSIQDFIIVIKSYIQLCETLF